MLHQLIKVLKSYYLTTCWGPPWPCCYCQSPPIRWSYWPCHNAHNVFYMPYVFLNMVLGDLLRSIWPCQHAYNVFYVPCVSLNNFLGDLLSSTMLSFSMNTCSRSYNLHPKYQVSHIKSTYYTWPRSFGDGPMPLKCNLRNFLIVLVKKMSGGELLCTTTARRLKFGIWTLWCIYFDNPLSFLWAKHFSKVVK